MIKFYSNTTQYVSHKLSDESNQKFVLDESRLIKTAISTGVAGVIPTYGNPREAVVNAIGSIAIGFNATFINSCLEVILTKMFK